MGEIVNIGASDYVGRIWQFNEDEDAAMEYLPHSDQVLYLRGMRKNMDFSTGIVGIRRAISYQGFKELLEINRKQGSTKASYAPTKDELRACIARLVKAGLIERINLNTGSRIERLVFKLPLAHVGQRFTSNKQPQHHATATPPAQSLDVAGPRGIVSPTSENQVNPIHQLVSKSDIKDYIEDSENSIELARSAQCDSLNLEEPKAKAVDQEAKGSLGPCPHNDILDLWKQYLPEIRQPKRSLWMGRDASRNLAFRWKQMSNVDHSTEPRKLYSDREAGLVWWAQLFEFISQECVFLTSPDANFFDLGWLVRKENLMKTLDGNYGVRK